MNCLFAEELSDGNAAISCKADKRNHSFISVTADNHAVNIGRSCGVACLLKSLREVVTESGAVEHTALSDNAIAREFCIFQREVSHCVHRIGNDNQNCFRRIFENLVDNTLDNFCVGADELFAGHAGLTRNAARDNNDLRACRRRVVIGHADNRRIEIEHVRRLHDVHRFAFGESFFNVDKDDFACKTFGREDVCNGRADIAGTNYSYFHL